MREQAETFFHNPEKKHLIWFGVLWVIGIGLLLLATTDLFRESFFQSKNFMGGLMILSSNLSVIKLFRNYKAHKTAESGS